MKNIIYAICLLAATAFDVGAQGISYWGNFNGNGAGLTNMNASQISGVVTNVNLTTPYFDDTVMTTFLPAPNSSWWTDDMKYQWASHRGNEWWFDESSTMNWQNVVQLEVPTNATSVTITFTARSLTGSAIAPGIELLDSAGGFLAGSGSYFIGTGQTAVSLTASSAISNAWLYISGSGYGGMAISNDLKVTFSPAPPGILSNAFKRYEVRPENVYKDGGENSGGSFPLFGNKTIPSPLITMSGTHSYFDFVTDSKNLVLVYHLGANLYVGSVYLDGPNGWMLLTNYTYPQGFNIGQYVPISLTSSNVSSHIRVFNGTENFGPMPCAVIVPSGNYVSFQKKENTRKVFVIGDSILSSILASNGGVANDLWRIMENYLPLDVYSAAQPSYTLAIAWGGIGQKSIVDQMASLKPAYFYDQLCVNDWAYGTPLLTYSNYQADMIDTLHDLSPSTLFFIQSPTPTNAPYVPSGAPADTLVNFSNAMRQVYLLRTNYCVWIDGSKLVNITNLFSDGIHPIDAVQPVMAHTIGTNFWLNHTIPEGLSYKASKSIYGIAPNQINSSVAMGAFSAGGSPYTFVNPTGARLECYITGGTTGVMALAKNGQAIYGQLTGADFYVMLQTNGSFTLTYSVTTPTIITNAW